MTKKSGPLIFLLLALAAGTATAEDYDLKAYLARVREHSKDLALARKDIASALLDVKAAWSNLLPSVYAQAGYNRNLKDVMQSYPVAVDTSGAAGVKQLIWQEVDVNKNNEFSAGLVMSQNLFNLKALDALKFGEEYSGLTKNVYDEISRSVLAAAKKLYFQTVLLDELAKVKATSEKSDRDIYLDMKKKFEAGAIQELDMLRAEVSWKSKIAETTQAKKNRDVALINLKFLAGLPPDAAVVLKDGFSKVPDLPQEAALGGVLSARSDYAMLLRQKRMAELAKDLARDDYYPVVSGSLTYGYQATSDSFKLTEDKVQVLQLGVKVSMPVYTGGAIAANLDKEDIRIEKAQLELKKKEDEVVTELRQIVLSLREARERIDSAKTVLETAERAFSIAKTALDNGFITQLELNESSVQLEGARLQYNLAVFDYLSAYFDWEKATGA